MKDEYIIHITEPRKITIIKPTHHTLHPKYKNVAQEGIAKGNCVTIYPVNPHETPSELMSHGKMKKKTIGGVTVYFLGPYSLVVGGSHMYIVPEHELEGFLSKKIGKDMTGIKQHIKL